MSKEGLHSLMLASEVEQLYKELSSEFSSMLTQYNLSCPTGCSNCCTKTDIEASVLEFLPFAKYVYETHQEEYFYSLLDQNISGECILHDLMNKRCSAYPYRGLICRLFGFSFSDDKFGNPRVISCKLLKTEKADFFNRVLVGEIDKNELIYINKVYLKLMELDPVLGTKRYPLNYAIRLALDKIGTALYYNSFDDNNNNNTNNNIPKAS
ncbi:MAG: YkgJ family cysteine cluster protein [Candidatus Delongbacteria bacterium]|nr:YkgJ family cysteine cluster protein [Candidatus Delongbacteria bacterium]MBN2834099.1 YkgJ family cysteine cluster protein [Candidatus Delongbacteria bacterium]